jgi:cellulose synthase/poly-beta-1,6-N-acetylglucosamine synthase-like glycosyltransferase
VSPLEPLSWALAAFVVYTFLGYPLAIWLLGSVTRTTARRTGRFDGSFSIVITAHNEEQRVCRRLRELTKLTAGERRRPDSIILVSDGSTDRTAALARRVEGVVLIELPVRRGKAVALNAGAAASHSDVLIFGDVRQRWAADSVERLLENFADEQVGGASGDLRIEAGSNTTIRGVGLYWRVEKWLRRQESRIHSSVGVTGAISAVRRELFPRLPEGTVLDDVYWPMVVVAKGFRVVHDERAVAFDRLPPLAMAEFHRKVRTLVGNYQLIQLLPSLLLPWRNPVWLQFLSHKVLRLASPWALLLLFAVTGALGENPYQRAAFLMQACGYVYGSLALDPRWGRRLLFGGAAASFLVLNAAAFSAFWVWCFRGSAGVWGKVSYGSRSKSLASRS